jgi:hypothetical protein
MELDSPAWTDKIHLTAGMTVENSEDELVAAVGLGLVDVTDEFVPVVWEADFGIGYSDGQNSDSRDCDQGLEWGEEVVEGAPISGIVPFELSAAESGKEESRAFACWSRQRTL